MKKATLSDDIRRLEELRAEGFLGERQYLREVREAMARHERDVEETEDAPPVPADFAAHSDPQPYDPESSEQPETPRLRLEQDEFPQPEKPSYDPGLDDFPYPAQGSTPLGIGQARVIIRGKSPFDEDDKGPVSLQSPRPVKEDASAVLDRKKSEAEILKRQKIARMAEQSNRLLRRKKNPDAALLMSLAWAGLGNLYIGQVGSGVLFMLIGGACWIAVAFGQYFLIWIALCLGLLSGALARKAAEMKNRSIDALRDTKLRMQPKVSQLNVDKSLRQTPPPAAPQSR